MDAPVHGIDKPLFEVFDDDGDGITWMDEAAAYAAYRKQWARYGVDLQRIGGKYSLMHLGKVQTGGTLQDCIDWWNEDEES
jgi:hypothetical protein